MLKRRLAFPLLLASLAACGQAPPMSQFGAYTPPYKRLRLADGDTFTVYRVKSWTFRDSSAPALQLEYEPGVSVADTAALRARALRIWPIFAAYLNRAGYRSGILTATNLRKQGWGLAWTAKIHHFGFVAERDSTGAWHFQGEAAPLPAAHLAAEAGIYEADGAPLQLGAAPVQ